MVACYRWLVVAWCMLLNVRLCLVFVGCRVSFVVDGCLLFVVCCLLILVSCLLFVGLFFYCGLLIVGGCWLVV